MAATMYGLRHSLPLDQLTLP